MRPWQRKLRQLSLQLRRTPPLALKVDNTDRPHIAYYAAINGDLRYVHWSRTALITQITVDSQVSNVASSISLTPADEPLISYNQWGALYLACWSGSISATT